MKKIPTKLIIGCISAVTLVILATAQIQYYFRPITIDAEYLNNEVLIGQTTASEVLCYTEMNEKEGVICFFVTPAEYLVMLYMEKNGRHFGMVETQVLDMEKITESPEKVTFIDPFRKDYSVCVSIFKNPSIDTIRINGEVVNIQKFNVTLNGITYELGFWNQLVTNDVKEVKIESDF